MSRKFGVHRRLQPSITCCFYSMLVRACPPKSIHISGVCDPKRYPNRRLGHFSPQLFEIITLCFKLVLFVASRLNTARKAVRISWSPEISATGLNFHTVFWRFNFLVTSRASTDDRVPASKLAIRDFEIYSQERRVFGRFLVSTIFHET